MCILIKIAIKEGEAEVDREVIEDINVHTLDQAPRTISTGAEEETVAPPMIGVDKIGIIAEMVTGTKKSSLAIMAIDFLVALNQSITV